MTEETLKQYLKGISENDTIEQTFMLPIKDLMLKLEVVSKDKNKKLPTPYVALTIAVPQDIAKTIPELMTSKWRLALFGVKFKEDKITKEL